MLVIILKFNVISKTTRTISIEIVNEECFYLKEAVNLYINNERISEINTNVYTINDLNEDTEYSIYIEEIFTKDISEKVTVKTLSESYVINVKDFGAKGDGINLDTAAVQTAIAACPLDGRIVVPKGKYLLTPIFLKSNITIELEEGAVLLGVQDREKYPILPGTLRGASKEEYFLGSWEGDPVDCFASLITGINVENVNIIGDGVIDGNANFDNWWFEAKTKRIAWRPRTIFLIGCKNILVESITVKNSPSWTIHPLMCEDLKFINLHIENPKDAPNTDGLDPESCKNVLISGVNFSVGDDCIAIKSGKIFISKIKTIPSQYIYIRNCNMNFGHGAVVIGSEMSSGVKNIYVENCLFNETDRGIRIKTRRGRGDKAIIDEIYARNLKMNKVLTPFTINCFYFCEVDGKTEYVWSKEKLPIDDRTPYVGDIYLKNITCLNTHVAAGFMYGLPERKIKKVKMENIYVNFDDNAEAGEADMLSFIEPMCKNGFYFNNIEELELKDVVVENAATEQIIKLNIDKENILMKK
jgi:polygalacturonase